MLEGFFTVLAVSLAALFASQAYFRQKEYELILKRYLEGSIDLLAGDLQTASAVFSNNWARSLTILKSFRDLGMEYESDELSKGFIELNSSNHNIVAHHRLHRLTGTMDYFNYYQSAMAYFTNANNVVSKEIPEFVRVVLAGRELKKPLEEAIEEAFQEAREQDDGSHIYIKLISEFQDLATALESEHFSFKELESFREKNEVKASIKRVEDAVKSLNPQQSENNEGHAN